MGEPLPPDPPPNDPDVERWLLLMDEKVNDIGNNTGPVFVTRGVPRDRFWKMYNESRAYKRGMLWEREEGEMGALYIQCDYSEAHEQARQWVFIVISREFRRLGLTFLGSNRLVNIANGGLLEFPNRCQQVDFFILEKSRGQHFREAKPIVVAQVVNENEDPQAVLRDMDLLTSANGGGKVALGIIVEGTEGDCTIFYKKRGCDTQILAAQPGNTTTLKWGELFEEEEVQEAVGSEETVIDWGDLQDHMAFLFHPERYE